MKKHFSTTVKVCIISVYLIILAGATVRMTGSGMGCPDWPKCFGHLIPPTSIDQLTWKPKTTFKKGTIIINDHALFVAKEGFTSSEEFDFNYWEPYTKHDYATFNATHTWVEYINRLVSALSGLFFLVLIIGSITFWKYNKSITLLSFFALFLMLFEAWLGKTVVDSNLATSKISIHMLVALAIVALLIIIFEKSRPKQRTNQYDSVFFRLSLVVISLSIVQIVLGIEVRTFVDEQLKILGFEGKPLLDLRSQNSFLIHRSFSILVVIMNIFLFLRSKKLGINKGIMTWVLVIILLEVVSGILMVYLDFPFGTQAIHLVFASILFGIQFHLVLASRKNKKVNVSKPRFP